LRCGSGATHCADASAPYPSRIGALHLRIIVTIDDALYAKALALADPAMDRDDIVREALLTFVRVQADKRLATLGGRAPSMEDVPRRRARIR